MMRATVLCLILALLVLTACELPRGSRPKEEAMSGIVGLEALDMQVLWPIVMEEIDRTGFQLDRDNTSMTTGEFESRWRMELAPFRFEGRRKRIVGVAREVPVGSGRFNVRLTVWTQRNADIEDPMDPSKAIWQDVEPDTATTDDLLYRIRKHFPDFRGSAEGGENPTGR
jgi:hypothetical protein